MAKYIKLEDAINAVEHDSFYTQKNLESLPTIEQSSKVGEWIIDEPPSKSHGPIYICPFCGHEEEFKPTNYCPACGEKMKGAENER